MPEPFRISLPSLLQRIEVSWPPPAVTETLRCARVWKHLVQDYRPLADSLEWQLARVAWNRQGVTPFVDGSVPFLVNNDGRLSANAAALVFAHCEETALPDGRVRVLELGAGTGLFARYFLDEFRDLCRRSARDFYDRLTYSVTDASPCTVEQWRERGIFEEHAERVAAQVLEAAEAASAGPARVVFCNYVLDVLPMAFVRKTARGWEQLYVRTWINDDRTLLRQFTRLEPDEIRAFAAAGDPAVLAELLPVLPLLECEAEYLPAGEDAPPGLAERDETREDEAFAYNYGAIGCLESVERVLEDGGFVLINDYGPSQPEGRYGAVPGQRFGRAVSAVLNLPLLEAHFGRRGMKSWAPEGDAGRSLHTRLFTRKPLPGTRRVFESRFAGAALGNGETMAQTARQQAGTGLMRQALESYRAAIEQNPRNWQLVAETAAFITSELRDPKTGLDLARAAIALNPWYSPYLWNVLGDCLLALDRVEDAHECYLEAFRIHPASPDVNLRLAGSWIKLGDPRQSLEAVARGLACDSDAMLRHVLFERQQEALSALSVRWNAECAAAARRRKL